MVKEETREPVVDPWTIVLHPLLTEKAIGKVETENKLLFIVKRKATKKQIRWAIERALDVKVEAVNTQIDQKGQKRAWIKLAKGYSASDIATKFGML